MAITQINLTVGGNDPNGVPLSVTFSGVGSPTGNAPATTTIDTDIATLVADGASPTQGHVNTLNTDWTAFKASITAYQAAQFGGNVSVAFDGSVITTRRQLKAALDAAMQAAISGFGALTP